MRTTRHRKVKRAKPSRIEQAQKQKMGVELSKAETSDEYIDDAEEDEWWSSDEEQNEDKNHLTIPNQNGADLVEKVEDTENSNFQEISFQVPPSPVPQIDSTSAKSYQLDDIDLPGQPEEDTFLPPPPDLLPDNNHVVDDFPPPLV